MEQLGVIILAAGVGKRMKSKIPKVLHPICGRPMLSYVVDTAVSLNPKKIVIVVGPKMDKKEILKPLKQVQGQNDSAEHKSIPLRSGTQERKIQFVIQDPPRGTGDAVLCVEPAFSDFDGQILVLCGDVPLLKSDTINELIKFHRTNGGAATVLTAIIPDPSLYGRIIKEGNKVSKIVEEIDALPEVKKINEINSGIYLFEKESLFEALHKVKPSNVQSEYYLTDTIEILCNEEKEVYAFTLSDWREVLGINTRKSLAEVEDILQAQIIERHQLNGVTIRKPTTTVIDFDVKMGKDTVIYPGVRLLGNTQIGEDCEIGANTIIMNSKISPGTKIGESSNIKDAIL